MLLYMYRQEKKSHFYRPDISTGRFFIQAQKHAFSRLIYHLLFLICKICNYDLSSLALTCDPKELQNSSSRKQKLKASTHFKSYTCCLHSIKGLFSSGGLKFLHTHSIDWHRWFLWLAVKAAISFGTSLQVYDVHTVYIYWLCVQS